MRVRRIEPLSLANLLGALYGAFALLMGLAMSVFFLIRALVGWEGLVGELGWIGTWAAIFAFLLMPLFYGAMGWISGAVTGWLYNLVASWTGGLELEVS